MTLYEQIFENNKKWVAEKNQCDNSYFENLAKSQSPEILYIGCSDSRVTAEEMMGLQPGQAFIHRNVANLVHAIDLNATAVITYAVKHLKVKHIIVCGHYNCGGVKAAMEPKDLGILNPWLRGVRDVYRIHQKELDAIADMEKRYEKLVELNVQEQCVNIIKHGVVQQHWLENGYPTVHGWVFDLHNGEIIDLKIDFEQILKNIQQIYNLTDDHDWFDGVNHVVKNDIH